MSDELLNLNEELDVEGHAKKGADEPVEDKGADEVEAHLLDNNLLDENLLDL